LSQTQTTSGEVFLSTRQQPATSGGFQVALEPEELFMPENDAETETIGYLTIDAGAGSWNEMPFVAALQNFVHNGGRRIHFTGTNFDTIPSFVASLASYVGADNAHLRVQNADLNGIDVRAEEDTTLDEELEHVNEDVAYLAIGGPGSLTAVSTPLVDGPTQTFQLEIADLRVVNDLDVNLELIHNRVEDLDIFLEAPDGTIVELFTDIGGTSGGVFATTLDDEAVEAISAAVSPISGSFQPEGLLRDFDGKAINGTWLLHVTDDTANGDAGALLNWSLDIELAPDPPGNLNYDSHVNATDIDMLFANIGSIDRPYDLDNDGDADMQDVDHLVLNIMGKRYGDTNIDEDVDRKDFNSVVMNYDPLGHEPFHGWREGNFDGDGDVDITDALRVVANFSPSGYQLVGSLSTGDELNASSLIAGENGNGIRDVGRVEPTGRGSDRPKTAEDGTTREPQSRYLVRASESSSGKSPSASPLLYLESVDRSFRRMGMRQEDSLPNQFRDLAI